MLKSLLLICALCAGSAQASAVDYSDIWFNPLESGWGVSFAQNGTFIFATFFLYGSSGTPTWYTGQLSLNTSDGSFSGPLYTSTGPYYGAATFDPMQVSTTPVGSATFRPAGVSGQITYNVGGVIVTKNIQRQTLTPIPLAGGYRGGVTGATTACADTTQNLPFGSFVDLAVSQTSPSQATFAFQYEGGASCTLTGAVEQSGALSQIASAAYVCSSGTNATISLFDVKVTTQGIEGAWAGTVGGNCFQSAHFSAASK